MENLKPNDRSYLRVSTEDECPEEDGEYIVFTRTPMGNVNIFETSFHWQKRENKEDKPKWGCTNLEVLIYNPLNHICIIW